MPEFDVDKTLIQIEADLASINKTNAALDSVGRHQKQIADEAKKASRESEAAGKKIVKAYQDVKKAAEDAAKASEKTRKEIEKSLSTKDAFGKASTGVGSVASVVGGVAGSGAAENFRLAGDVAGAAEQVPALIASVAALGPVGIAGAVAMTGFAVAIGGALAETQKVTDATKARLSVEADIVRIAVTGTRDQLEAKRAQLDEEFRVQAALFDRLKPALDAAESGLTTFDQVRETFNLAYGEIDALREAVLGAGAASSAAFNGMQFLAEELGNNVTAANDLKAATAALAIEQQKLADQFVNTQIATLIKAQSLNSEGAKARLQSIADEVAAIERFNQTSGQSEAGRAALQARLDNLATEYTLLQTLVPTLIAHNDELARQKKELAESEKAFQATAAAMKSFNVDIKALEEKTAEQRLEIQSRYADVAADLAEKQADALADRNDGLIEADADAIKARAENERDANKDREAESKRHNDALKRIDSDFQSAKQTAIQNRDVVGRQAADAARRQALAEENKANKDRLSEIDDALSEQNRAVDDKLKEQTAAVEKRYAEQADAAKKASDKANEAIRADLSALDSKYAAEILKRNQANVAELNLLNTHYTTREAIERQYLEALNAQAQKYLFKSTQVGPTQDTGHVIPFADGGSAPANRTLLVGERGPELIRLPQAGMVSTASQTRAMMSGGGGGITIPITVNGVSRRAVETTSGDIARRTLDEILKEAGF